MNVIKTDLLKSIDRKIAYTERHIKELNAKIITEYNDTDAQKLLYFKGYLEALKHARSIVTEN